MKSYYRLMLGRKSKHAELCFAERFVGVDFDITEDLTGKLPDEWRMFNQAFIPVFLEKWPDKSKIAAGLACGSLWVVAKGMQKGDVLLCPNGSGHYRVAEICGDYTYAPGEPLPHRRPVHWLSADIERSSMSDALKNATGSIGTVCNISGHRDEIEKLIGGAAVPTIVSTDETVEDASAFAMEQHLEEFLVQNWAQTEFAADYGIYSEDGEQVGQQYATDTGPLDILAVSKDKKRLLVIELKKGRASDVVVGQILRYMGYVQEELAEEGQTVHGAIIALEDDQRIRRALSVTPNIAFYRYQISFKLIKSQS